MESFIAHFDRYRWAVLYQKAVAEVDDGKRLDLIGLATGAIFERKQQLAHSPTAHLDEQEALELAEYVLAALRQAAEFNRGQRRAFTTRRHRKVLAVSRRS